MKRAALLAAAAVVVIAAQAVASSELDVAIGRALFRRVWVPAPSSTLSNDGLGPLFNARSCQSCHRDLLRAAVRSGPDGGFLGEELVLRLSDRAGRPDPIYGMQLQTSAIPGLEAEGRVRFGPARRSAPADLAYGPLAAGMRSGGRIAPALRGLGLLAAIPEDAILARADPEDRDGDGVRGRANLIMAPDGGKAIGRFGWKAQSTTIAEQTALAFSNDLGLSTARFPAPWGDCTPAQPACRAAPHGGTVDAPEIGPEMVERVVVYLASIAPPSPAARPGPEHTEGAALFSRIGCSACHAPAMPSPSGPVHAFTDLLLHDLGEALDGGATEPGVAPNEWRTAPLWGVSRTLEAGAGLLHDGRARGIAEAVSLHGGEASRSRSRFNALSKRERDSLLSYVGSL